MFDLCTSWLSRYFYREIRLMKLIISFVVLLNHGIVFADEYLCVTEKVTGIKYIQSTESWEIAEFNEKLKFKIHSKIAKPEYKYIVEFIRESELAILPYRCKDDFNGSNILHCGLRSNQFAFNRKSSRFTVSNIALSYAHVDIETNKREFSDIVKLSDAGSAPSLIAIGTCSPIEN